MVLFCRKSNKGRTVIPHYTLHNTTKKPVFENALLLAAIARREKGGDTMGIKREHKYKALDNEDDSGLKWWHKVDPFRNKDPTLSSLFFFIV